MDQQFSEKINPRANRVEKNLSLGDLFETAAMLPRMLSGKHDWEGAKHHSFVMIRINNKKSDLDGRHVILERTKNGTYRIARRPDSHDRPSDHHKMEKLEKDEEDFGDNEEESVEKGFGLRSKRRTPSRASARRFTSLSVSKSMDRLKRAISEHCQEE